MAHVEEQSEKEAGKVGNDLVVNPISFKKDAHFAYESRQYASRDYQVTGNGLQNGGALTLDNEPEVEATIAWLRQQFEAVRQHEVKRMHGRLGQLSTTQVNAIESLTHCIIDQILETPIRVLKAASEDGGSFAIVKTVRRTFSLRLDPSATASSESSERVPS